GGLGGRAGPAGGRRVGVLRALPGRAAGEDTDVGSAEVTGQFEQGADLGQHGRVVTGRRHPDVPGGAQDLDTGRLERGGDTGPFGRGETRVDRFLRVGAQLDAVITVRGRQLQHVGDGQAGDAEGGERQLHGNGPYPRTPPATPP